MQERLDYSQVINKKYPEQVVIVLARDDQNKCNPMSIGWTMITSGEPPMMAIAISQKSYTLSAIRHSKAFVISYPSEAMKAEIQYFGSKSGRDTDKLLDCGTQVQPASEINCVILTEAVANFECTLEKEMITGDHVLLVGRIVAAHANKDGSLSRLYNMGGQRFGIIS